MSSRNHVLRLEHAQDTCRTCPLDGDAAGLHDPTTGLLYDEATGFPETDGMCFSAKRSNHNQQQQFVEHLGMGMKKGGSMSSNR